MHINGIITTQFLLILLMLIDDEVIDVFDSFIVLLRGVVGLLSGNVLGQLLTLLAL